MDVMNFTTACHLFCDVWQLYKIFAARELTEGEMNALIEETGRLHDKYSRSKLGRDMLLAVMNEIERTDKFIRREG